MPIVSLFICYLLSAFSPAILKNYGILAPLIFFKYLNILVDVLNDLTGIKNLNDFGSLHLILALGISFYVFHFISYFVDVYRKKVPEKDLKNFAIYIALFPHLITGPLVRYSEIKQQLNVKHRRLVKSDLFWGMVIFSTGLAKKLLLPAHWAPLSIPYTIAPKLQHTLLA